MRRALGAALLIAALAPAQASVLSDILQRGVLRVGSTGDYPPFTKLDKASGDYAGFDVDLARALGGALGVRVEFVATSWPTLAGDFQTGRFDVAMGGISITLERAKLGFFTTPYLREGKTPIARCADKDKFATLAEIDRAGVTVLVNPGGGNEKFDRAHLHAARIDVRPDNTAIFDALAHGEGDLMITDASETRYQQKLHQGVLCAIHPDAPFDFGEKAYWAPYDPPLDGFLDQWLHQIRETGAFAAIYAKWF
ncbi:MAG: transporter substrate-binding domain-containing protein [Pseudomonadota bacterium]|nr:transporter substrate-binding domain-containing protein [Pseudomonadota bacterium]